MKKHIGLGDVRRVHFIGIGGVSMSGLAEILFKDGFIVSGSDWTAKDSTNRLQSIGIDVYIGPGDAGNITADIDLVVYTAAVKPNNPERMAANAMGIPTMVRAELLNAILQGYEYAVCVAGSHGKTSTTALITSIALAAGLDPTVNIGGYIGETNYYVGDSPYFILEACEYSNSFHHWHPHIGVILNIDADHLDFYGSMDAIIDAFAKFASNIRPTGTLIIQEGIQGFGKITAGLKCKVRIFKTIEEILDSAGLAETDPPSYWLRNMIATADSSIFDVMEGPDFQARITLPLPGKYNMHNALAAFAIAREMGVEPQVISAALSQTQGAKRRYEHKGEFNGAIIIDDYAHHPTEIKAFLAATREAYPERRLICLFQPHTYTRTRDLFDDFAQAFTDADITLFAPIYAAREPFDPSISSEMLSKKVGENGHVSINCNNLEDAEAWLRGKLMPHDLLITMGAGDVYFVGERLIKG